MAISRCLGRVLAKTLLVGVALLCWLALRTDGAPLVFSEQDPQLLNCLCNCLNPPGGQFSCSYDTTDRGWSPSCAALNNGPCICKAYGCFRGQLPVSGDCYNRCYARLTPTVPPTPRPATPPPRTATPAAPKPTVVPTRLPSPSPTPSPGGLLRPAATPTPQTSTPDSGTRPPLDTGSAALPKDCTNYCQQSLKSRAFVGKEVSNKGRISGVIGEGVPPDCACIVDYSGPGGALVRTERFQGDTRTEYTFDPSSGQLQGTRRVSISEEREQIRARLGFRHTEEQIDKLVEPGEMVRWFSDKMKGNTTETRLWHPQFWWQHFIALLDHGASDSSADFADTYGHGRCGDMMLWLERNLERQGVPAKEGMLSITGEKYANLINHTALIVRPQGVSNEEWGDLVKRLTEQSGGAGVSRDEIRQIENALALDPYFKKITTVKEFVRGWSVVRIS